jgi:Fe-S oxidoreductase
MPVPIGNTLGIFADNSRLRKSVLPLPGGKVTAWAGGLGLPAGGETVLYTGQMYQLVPTINAMSRRLAKFEDAWITRYFGVGRKVNRLINLSAFIARADPAEQRDYDGRLRNIARLLRAAGVEFGYVYENDLYSGALVYDEGLDDVLAPHAGLVYRALKSGGVKRLITVDPHTTSLLRTVYPRVVPGFDIEVKSYLEVLAERPPDPAGRLDRDVTVHDSCIYARYEDVIEPPRRLLKAGGVRIQEAELSGKLTQCCGGPLESLFPRRAAELAERRIGQLADCAGEIVTMCPICLANLRRAAPADMTVRDISEYLVEAYCPDGKRPG